MIFYKLKPEKTIIAWDNGNPGNSSLAGVSPVLIDEFGTVLTYPLDNPPTYSEFPGIETTNLRYVMFSLNDSSTSRQLKTLRISIGYGDALNNNANILLLLPCNKPVRIHIPLNVINAVLTNAGMTYANLNKKFLEVVNPSLNGLPDIMTVYSYQQY